MKTNRLTQLIIAAVAIALLATSGTSHAALPGDSERAASEAVQIKARRDNVPQGLTANEWASMQDLMREARYQFTWQVSDGAWAYRAPNPAHDLSLSMAADGLHAVRYGAAGEPLWDLRLSLVAYGEQAFPGAIAEAGLVGRRERVEYHWSRDVVEWYVNGANGIEHGLTLAAPPVGDGATIELTFALRGSLIPELDGSGQALQLKDASGEVVLRYDQLAVYDAMGRALPAHMRLDRGPRSADPQLAAANLQLVVDAAGAAYPLTVDPLLHSQAAKLTASDAEADDGLGVSVAIDGSTVVVGAYREDGAGSDQGAAYVYERNRGGVGHWGEVTKLTTVDAKDDDYFGISVAIGGNAGTIVVGVYGQDGDGADSGGAYVYARNRGGADAWGEVTRLAASDAAASDSFGTSVAISEDGGTVVVGAPYQNGAGNNRGAAYVYMRNAGGADSWGEVAKLIASDATDSSHFGHAVAISGDADAIVVGAYRAIDATLPGGAAYLYQRNEGGANHWGEVAKLTASDAANYDNYGMSVAISEDGGTVVVGAPGQDRAGTDLGAAYLYERNHGGADAWGEATRLTLANAADYDNFGYAVGISGDTVVAGAYGRDGAGANSGAAYLYERNHGGADAWGQVTKLTAADGAAGDMFGLSVAISGDTAIVGAYGQDGAGANSGAAYLYTADGCRWQEVAAPTAADAAEGDLFGISVSIDGDTVAVGARERDGTGTDRGAVYILERNERGADLWGQVTRLTASDAADGDRFGHAVAISGNTVVVGAAWRDGAGTDRGAAYIYARNHGGADNWGEVDRLTAFDAADYDYFGHSVAIHGDTAVVGAYWEDGAGSARGAAYVYARNQGGADKWEMVTKLTALGAADDDFFGTSVATSGDTIVVGANGRDGAGSDRGAAYVYARNQGGADKWGQVTRLTASDAADNDYFGTSVAIGGDIIVVGAAWWDGAGSDRGAAYVYERNEGGADKWGEVTRLTASDAADDDYFGMSAAINGDASAIVIGAYGRDGAGSNSGAAYVYARTQDGTGTWGQVTRLTASDAADDNYFGWSVAISGHTAIAGAPGHSGADIGSGKAYVVTVTECAIYLPLVLKNR